MTETNFTDQDIDTLLRILDAASRGPATWCEPITGFEHGRRDPVFAFAEMLYPPEQLGSFVRDVLADFRDALKKVGIEGAKVHGVGRMRDGSPVQDGDEPLVVAITGNGEKSEANAKAISAMLDPRFGFAAALRALRELQNGGATAKTPRDVVHVLNTLMREGRATREEVAPIVATINRLGWETQQANEQAMLATQRYNAKCEEMGQSIEAHAARIEEHAARIDALSGHIDYLAKKEPCNCGGPQLFDAQVALEAARQRWEDMQQEDDPAPALEDLAMLIARARAAVDAAIEKLPTVAGVVTP